MAEESEKRIIVLTEGHLDRIVIEQMLRGHDPEVYPRKADRQRGGKEAAISDMVVRVRNQTARLVLALDINGGDEAQLCSEIETHLRRNVGELRRDPARRNVLLFGVGSSLSTLCLWPIGFRGDPVLHALGIERHSVEDLLIKALHVPDCLAKVVRRSRMPADGRPWETVGEMLKVAASRGSKVDSSKDVLRIFLGLIGFHASLATFGGDVMNAARGTAAEALFERPSAFELP